VLNFVLSTLDIIGKMGILSSVLNATVFTLNRYAVIMLSMIDELSSFVNWANSVMKEKNITQADIARTGYVTSSAVSLLFSLRIKSVGVDMCRAISDATGIPLITIYRKAGLLPNVTLTEAEAGEIAALMSEITDPDLRQDAHDQLMLLKQKQNRRKNKGNPTPDPKAPITT
jgi:hypothetical protein